MYRPGMYFLDKRSRVVGPQTHFVNTFCTRGQGAIAGNKECSHFSCDFMRGRAGSTAPRMRNAQEGWGKTVPRKTQLEQQSKQDTIESTIKTRQAKHSCKQKLIFIPPTIYEMCTVPAGTPRMIECHIITAGTFSSSGDWALGERYL